MLRTVDMQPRARGSQYQLPSYRSATHHCSRPQVPSRRHGSVATEELLAEPHLVMDRSCDLPLAGVMSDKEASPGKESAYDGYLL